MLRKVSRIVLLLFMLSTALGLAPTPLAAQSVDPNYSRGRSPVLDLVFTAQGQAVDRSLSRLVATVTGGIPTTSPDGPALRFEREGERVSVASSTALGNLNRFLAETWVTASDPSAEHTLLATDYFSLRLNRGYLEGLVRTPTGGWEILRADGLQLTAGSWYHLAFSYDGSRGTLFINGAPQAAKAMTAGKAPTQTGVLLGRQASTAQFLGTMSRARIWPWAVDAQGPTLHLDMSSQNAQDVWDSSGWGQQVENRDVKFDGAAYFNGQSSYLKVNDADLNGNLQQFTVDLDFKATHTRGRLNLVEANTFALFVQDGQLIASVLGANGEWQDGTRAQVAAGERYRAVMGYDGDRVWLYLNGRLMASAALKQSVMATDRQTVFIGTHPSLTRWFSGQIFNVKLFNSFKAGGQPLTNLSFDTGTSEKYEGRDVTVAEGSEKGSQALEFNGKSSTVVTSMEGATGENFSLRTFVMPHVLEKSGTIARHDSWWFGLEGNRLTLVTRDEKGQATTLTAQQPLREASKWYEVAFSYKQGTGTLYVDGDQVGEMKMAQPGPTRNQRITIGSDLGERKFFLGRIDNLSIWPGILIPPWWFRDLKIKSVELTQAIQTATNTVPLVYGKKTVARVFVKTSLFNIGNVRVKVYGYQNGVPLPGSPMTFSHNWDSNAMAWASYTAKSSPNREQTFDSLNIELPSSWSKPPSSSAPISLWFEVNPNHTITESNYSNNWFHTTTYLNVVPTLYVKRVPLTIIKGSSVYSTNYASFNSLVPFMRKTYPVASAGGVTLLTGPTLTVNANPATAAGWNTVWSAVTSAYFLNIFSPHTVWYGLIPEAAGGAYYGMGFVPGYVSVGMSGPAGPEYYGRATTMAHEIGHNHGRPHASFDHGEGASGSAWPYPHGGIGDVGFDTQFMRALPPGNPAGTHFHDFMAYGYPRWVSIKGWNDMMNARKARPNLFATEPATPVRHFVVTGLIRPDGQVEVGQSFQVMRSPTASEERRTDYVLQALDASGKQIGRRNVSTIALNHNMGEGHMEGYLFAEAVALEGNANPATVQLLKGSTPIMTLKGSANAPKVEVLSPAGQATVGDQATIQWNASDPDGGKLTYSLQYSVDGKSWTPIVAGLTEKSFQWATAEFAGSSSARIRVLASDGFHTTTADSLPFTVARKAPVISLEAPTTMATGRSLVAVATVTDAEDGALTDTALTWQVDGGRVSTGVELGLELLKPGSHQIVLTAKDSDGQTATAKADVQVTVASDNDKPLSTLIQMQIDNPQAQVNKIDVYLDSPPTIRNDRTLVPIRFIAEGMGAEVEWNGATRQVTLTTETDVILLTIDSHIGYVNGQQRYLDVPPTIINDRTMLPVRFVSENLGAQVSWNEAERRVTITK